MIQKKAKKCMLNGKDMIIVSTVELMLMTYKKMSMKMKIKMYKNESIFF